MESIWSATADMPRFEPLAGDIQTDVLIIGGGMAGVLCAKKLKDAGVDCILVEAQRIGSGITSNTTAKITAQHGLVYHKLIKRIGRERTALYLKAQEQAVKEFASMCQNIQCDFSRQDSYVYSVSGRAKLEREMAALNSIDFHAELVDDIRLPIKTDGAVRFRNQGQFHPMKFLSGISQGLPIYENTKVRQLVGCNAVTDRGTIFAKKIIVATHFPFLNKHGSYFLKQFQHRSYVMALDHAKPVEGMYLDENQTGFSFRMHDGLLLLGGGSHRTGKTGGGYQVLEDFAMAHYPQGQIRYRWATQDCMTLDGVPYIGHYSARTPDLYVATGFNKWGMTASMVAANLLKDMITGRENLFQPVFSPSRNMLHPKLAVNAFEATVNILMPTKKRCPHMGCALKWNAQEHSWDCPCHGSRFAEDGKLLDNPATDDLNIE